jgi:hypothetical protein
LAAAGGEARALAQEAKVLAEEISVLVLKPIRTQDATLSRLIVTHPRDAVAV